MTPEERMNKAVDAANTMIKTHDPFMANIGMAFLRADSLNKNKLIRTFRVLFEQHGYAEGDVKEVSLVERTKEYQGKAATQVHNIKKLMIRSMASKLLITKGRILDSYDDNEHPDFDYIDDLPSFLYRNHQGDYCLVRLYSYSKTDGFFDGIDVDNSVGYSIPNSDPQLPLDTIAYFFDLKPYNE